MRNATHLEWSGYEKTQPLANAATAVFPNSECNDRFGALHLTDARQRSPKNETPRTGAALPGSIGNDADEPGRRYVLAVLRGAYRVARCEFQRVQTDMDLLVGIARALEAEIYDPGFALERALEHGLVAWADVEIES